MTDLTEAVGAEATQPADPALHPENTTATRARKPPREHIDLVLCGHDGLPQRGASRPRTVRPTPRARVPAPRPTVVDGTPLNPEATASISTTILT